MAKSGGTEITKEKMRQCQCMLHVGQYYGSLRIGRTAPAPVSFSKFYVSFLNNQIVNQKTTDLENGSATNDKELSKITKYA